MVATYNEIEPFAVEWLRNLIAAGHIAPGDVDDRSIKDLAAADVVSRAQAHYFAGIGVWSRALRLAGVPDDFPVWTGSCPCQPFSAAGKRGGVSDERHLWPTWFELIKQCRPPLVFGEQVASPDGLAWLDTVSSDLEGAGYTFAAFDICAASFGAPHIRQRLYFVAYADGDGLQRLDPHLRRWRSREDRLEVARRRAPRGAWPTAGGDGKAHASGEGGNNTAESGPQSGSDLLGCTSGFWRPCEWVACRDGKARPVEPGTFPLAHGATARVGRLRAYGNAIVAPEAAGFIEDALGAICELLGID